MVESRAAAPRADRDETKPVKASVTAPDDTTTLMIRNLPLNMTLELLIQNLDAIGLRGAYDYVYMPQTKKNTCKGYVFVNFTQKMQPSDLDSRFSRSNLPKKDRLLVAPAQHQGVLENLEHMVSFGLDMDESSCFSKPWVRVDGVLKPLAAPVAYEIYKNHAKKKWG
jgi:hypothetical protein